jgi:hypothetical protein
MATLRLLLTCKRLPETARRHVTLRRRLKGLRAVGLQSGVCLAPTSNGQVRQREIVGTRGSTWAARR